MPARRDGSKRPALGRWKWLQTRLPTDEQLVEWFGGEKPYGVAILCGEISGHLETIDFDKESSAIFPAWCSLVELERPGLVERLSVVRSPREPAGYHARYRCTAAKIPGNETLASDPNKPSNEAGLIETRGEGGYALAPGTPAECHKAGKPYVLFSGPPISRVPDITADEREALLRCARSFDRRSPPSPRSTAMSTEELRPGDDFDQRGPDWSEILEPAGWVCVAQHGDARYWRRPGKADSWSATTGVCKGQRGESLLRVFTTSAHPFTPGAYGKFRAFAAINHRGDLAEAARQLGLQGYGERPRRAAPQQASHARQNGESIILRGSQITPRKTDWLWYPRIPLGKLTTFGGVAGLGKTFVLCDITSRITQGTVWPFSQERADPAQALFITAEDDLDDTLVPRLIQLGADLDRVIFLRSEAQDRFTLADMDTLDTALQQAGGNVKFVAIDPPTAFLGGADDHKNSELRQLLGPLRSWAARHRVAVVFNTHFNKASGKVDAMMRIIGGVTWVNMVRTAHVFARDPDDYSKCVFVCCKNNLAPMGKGLRYKINVLPDRQASLEWLDEVDVTADQAVNKDTGKPRGIMASEWLTQAFLLKQHWQSDDLFREASQDGISRNAIFEAKAKLNLPKAQKSTLANGDVVWTWYVPETWEGFKGEIPPWAIDSQERDEEEI